MNTVHLQIWLYCQISENTLLDMKKQIIGTLSNLFPSMFAEFAYRQLTNPQIKKLRENELAVLAAAKQETIPFKGFAIKTYCWEGGSKNVLLIHGW